MVRRTMSRAGLVGFLLILVIVVYVIAGSFSADTHTCEVCMEYEGESQCRTVSAATLELARDGAIQNACAFISSGVTGSIACGRGKPLSEKCQ
jgi:hypothetical protein